MKEAVSEVITWCNAHPDELVVYYLTACDGESGCKQASLDLMAAMGVHTISNCSELSNLTIEDAKAMGKLVDGGTLLGLYDCVSEQYDPSVNCYGKGFACYDAWPTESTEYPWEKMTTYMDAATQQVPTTDGQLWMAQVMPLCQFCFASKTLLFISRMYLLGTLAEHSWIYHHWNLAQQLTFIR